MSRDAGALRALALDRARDVFEVRLTGAGRHAVVRFRHGMACGPREPGTVQQVLDASPELTLFAVVLTNASRVLVVTGRELAGDDAVHPGLWGFRGEENLDEALAWLASGAASA